MKYNKGEWAEAYAFIKLIGNGNIFASDEDLNIVTDKVYPILKVFKIDIGRYYEPNTDEGIVNIVTCDEHIIGSLKTSDFLEISEKSLPLIIKGDPPKRTFEVPILKNFLNNLGIEKFKGSSSEKTDITMELWDEFVNTANILNFSIKSYLGSSPTLMNASPLTNFTFKIEGMSKDEMLSLNNINRQTAGNKWLKLKFNKIFQEYCAGNYDISWVDENNNILYQNLRLIDSNLPKMLAFMLFYFYSNENSVNVSLLTEKLIKFNPLSLEDGEKDIFYKKKIIEFLEAVAFGMMPKEKWVGNNEITGGLLTVKKDGNIVCHHLFYDYGSLKEYLFKYTKFDSPSSSRHKYGRLFLGGDDIFFKLNLQVRFK